MLNGLSKSKRAFRSFSKALEKTQLARRMAFRPLSFGSFRLPVRTYLEWSNKNHILDSWTSHMELKNWVKEQISHLQPSRVHLCDGSIQENEEILKLLTAKGTLIQLNPEILPNSYLSRSDKNDVARLENCTFICSESKIDAGPTNNWKDPMTTTTELNNLFENCMRGRTMYVVPFCMGPIDSKNSIIGIQITDSALVVAQMRIMTRMGISVIKAMGETREFVPCIHSIGKPLDRTDQDSIWPSNENKIVVHFPEQQRIVSYGSAYGGNALLSKKCLGLRLASYMAKTRGWLAEHMLIISVTSPNNIKKYFAAAFPSACGKTNMAMLKSTLPGWKVECLGDDIAWMHLKEDGRLYALNPEFGFFGVAPGTSYDTNPHMMECLKKDTLYINVGLMENFDVWWEGKTKQKPDSLVTWMRKEWKSDDPSAETAHANSRFCTPIRNCPILDPNWDNPEGVPIEAIILGGRRSDVVPLVYQSRDWAHGVFMGSIMGSETTAAAVGRRGLLRMDPFAMKPFCGYNMADYFGHWLSMEDRSAQSENLPKIFSVNWFRKRENKIVWPGYAENMRVLKWIFEQCENDSADNYKMTSIGKVPKKEKLDVSNLSITKEDLEFLLKIDQSEWKTEIERYKEFYTSFDKEKMPKRLLDELSALEKELSL